MNFHLNRRQRRYLAKSVGAKPKHETLTQRFDRIRRSQEAGRYIHQTNVENLHITDNYIPETETRLSDEEAQAEVNKMIENAQPIPAASLSALTDLGID